MGFYFILEANTAHFPDHWQVKREVYPAITLNFLLILINRVGSLIRLVSLILPLIAGESVIRLKNAPCQITTKRKGKQI